MSSASNTTILSNENHGYFARLCFSYLMLFTFLGNLGGHRFYLGRDTSGIIYLFTFGLCGVGVFFDFFFIPFMAAFPKKSAWL
jgi:TM2 domain-containing membrane protein YozV